MSGQRERCPMQPGADSVLIVVDVQNDFLPGGALAVPHGDEILPLVNQLAGKFEHVILTQDWHPAGHISFASSHAGKAPYDMIDLPYGPQILWPDHCIQGTQGAALSEALDIPKAELILRKGYHPDTDSYSAFAEANRKTRTGLTGYLKERGFLKVFCVGLATDFCVSWTALDALDAGFHSFVIEDACRAIDNNGSLDAARKQWQERGIEIVSMD